MVVNLNNVSHIAINGLRVELHFKDSSSHMRRFSSEEEMISVVNRWREKTALLSGREEKKPAVAVEAIRSKPKPIEAKQTRLFTSRNGLRANGSGRLSEFAS